MPVDISDLPVPSKSTETKSVDISDLPVPSAPKEPTSAPKAYGKALAEQAGGTAGAWAGAKAGLKLGLKAPGITKLVAAPIGTIVGGGLGFWAGQKAQKEALEQVPESVKEKVGFDRAQRARERGEQPAATMLGTFTPEIIGVGSLAVGATRYGTSKLYGMLNDAFGGDAKKLASSLKSYAATKSGEEAKAASKLAQQAESKAAEYERSVDVAKTSAESQERQAAQTFRELPGTKTKMEAGRYRPVPETTESIGTRIKSYADKVMTSLKSKRDAAATKNKAEAFNEALAKEKQGLKVENTAAFKNMTKAIDTALKNPETGLSNVPVAEVASQLQKVKTSLTGIQLDRATGEVVTSPVSFEGMELMRRSLRDRSYGLPAEGYDAIGQQQAGKLADAVEKAMEEFSPKIRTFLDQYRKDSEPLRVFHSKIGKALVGEQEAARGYASVASSDIPSRVFKNKDSFESLVDSLGGNRELANAEARKFFTSEMEKLSNDPAKIEKFILSNRSILESTGSKKMAEEYLANASKFAKRSEAGVKRVGEAEKASKLATKESEKLASQQKEFETIQSQINVAKDASDIVSLNRQLADKLLKSGSINQVQYRKLLSDGESVLSKVKDAAEARQKFGYVVAKALGWGAAGGIAYSAIKSYGEE